VAYQDWRIEKGKLPGTAARPGQVVTR